MSKVNTLLRNTLIYTVGNIGSKALSFLLLPVYSYFLSKKELGEYDLITVTVTLLVPLISLQLSQANYRWLINKEEDNYSNNQIFITTLTSLIILNFLSCGVIFIASTFTDIYNQYLIMALLVTSSFFPFIQDSLRGLKNNKLYAKIGIINSIFILIFTVLFLKFTELKIEALLLSSILANIVSISIGLSGIKQLIIPVKLKYFNKDLLLIMLKYSWPLVPSAISWWLINAANRYIIMLELNTDANGIYAVSSRLPAIIFIFNSIFMLAWQDFILLEKKDSNFSKNVFEMLSVALLSLVFIAIVWSKLVVGYAFHIDFFESWKYMGILFLAVAFSCFSAYFGTAYLKEKNTFQIMTTTLLGGGINVLISYTLIHKIGLFAPAIGTLVGFIVVFIMRVKQTREFYPIHFNYIKTIIITITCIITIILTLLNNSYLTNALMVISVPLCILLNKDSINAIFTKLKSK